MLVIEDDAGVRDTTVALLSESGYTVSECSDGASGLDRLRSESFDVVVLDLRLPRLNGTQILEALEAPPPVIVVSAFEYFDEGELRAQFGAKLFALLQKPIAPERLLAAVAEATRGDRPTD